MNPETKSLLRSMAFHSAIVGIALLLNGCAIDTQVSPDGRPAAEAATEEYSPAPGPAEVLYLDAQSALAAGDAPGAELNMERALRIEPRNAHYWYTMARIKYLQSEYDQTVQLCLKSKSMAGRNHRLQRLNDDLIDTARAHL